MDKSTCIMKTYHPKIDKLQCWEKRPFYTTYAPRTRIEEHETRPMLSAVHVSPYAGEHGLAILVMILVVIFLLLVGVGIILVVLLS